ARPARADFGAGICPPEYDAGVRWRRVERHRDRLAAVQPNASAARYLRQGLLQRNPHFPQHATTFEMTRFPTVTLVRPRNRHKSNIVTDCCMSDAPSAQDVGGRLSSARGSVELGWAPINRL